MTDTAAPAGKVLFRNVTTGQLGYVDAAKAQAFVDDPDYRPASTAELVQEKRDAENQTFSGKAETALLGAAENVSDTAQTALRLADSPLGRLMLPGGGVALQGAKAGAKTLGVDLMDPGRSLMGQAVGAAMGSDAEQYYGARARELKQANPGAWTVGEVAGGVATGLATGGLSTGLTEVAAGGLARMGVRQGLSQVAGTGLAMAAEGGFYGAAGAETQARLSGKTTGASAEELLQGIGLGALLGGGLGAGGGATMAAFRKLVARGDGAALPGALGPELRAAEASEQAADGFRQSVADSGSGLPRLWEAATGADRETLERFGPHVHTEEAIEGRRLWQNRDQIIESAVPKVTDAMDQLEDALQSITSNVKQFELKEHGVSRMLQDVDQNAAKRIGVSSARAVEGNLSDLIAQIPGGAETKSIRERLTKTLQYTRSHIDEMDHRASASRVYVASDFIKKELQRTIDSLQFTSTRAQTGTTMEAARNAVKSLEEEIHEPFRRSLEQEKVWGRAGEAQREINARWKPFIDTGDRFKDELMKADSQKVWADGRRVFYADSAKIASWLDGAGTTRGATAQAKVREHIAATVDLLESVQKYHPLDSEQVEKLALARRAYETVSGELATVDKTIGIANKIEDVARAERKASTLTSPLGGRIVGTVAGAVAGGPMGGTIGALGLLNKPASAMAAADQIRGLADRIGVRVAGKAAAWVKGGGAGGPRRSRVAGLAQSVKTVAVRGARATADTVERGAKTTRKVVVPASVAALQGRDKDLETAYGRKADLLVRANADSAWMLERISDSTGGLNSVDPDLAGSLAVKAQAAIGYLVSQLPSGTLDPTALEPGRKAIVSRPEMMRFARIWQAVERPMSVLEDLERGMATPEQIEAVRVCHPETYQAIRSSVQNALLEVAQKGERVPLGMRLQLDLLLDLGGAGEPAFAPEVTDRVAALQGKRNAEQRPKAAGKVPDFAKSAQLPQQKWPTA